MMNPPSMPTTERERSGRRKARTHYDRKTGGKESWCPPSVLQEGYSAYQTMCLMMSYYAILGGELRKMESLFAKQLSTWNTEKTTIGWREVG
jgi:hypothetical protein